MTKEHLASGLRAWLKDTEAQPDDARRSTDKVMARVEEAAQRGRWWPLPVFHRKIRTDATAIGTTEYQPSPIPAINGNALIAIGRTKIMFSPVKIVIAGALVFALGGLFLVGQPFAQQQGAQPGAESDSVGAMADVSVGPGVTYFTGTSECTSERGDSSMVDGVTQSHLHSTCEYTTTDDRFNGTMEVDNTVYSFGPDGGPWTSEEVLVSGEGAWRGTSQGVYDMYGVSPLGTAGKVFHYGQSDFVGEGAYEGYVAHYYFAGNDDVHSLTGWITSGE
jgi:hypothetical protein